MSYLSRVRINEVVSALPPAVVDKKVLRILLSRQYRQRTEEWYEKRKSILTASDAAAALNIGKFQNRKGLILKKAGLVQAQSSDAAKSPAMEHGIKYEDEAAQMYLQRYPELGPFFEVGLVMHPDHPFLGASPDRITKDGILIEIKVPPLSLPALQSSVVCNLPENLSA